MNDFTYSETGPDETMPHHRLDALLRDSPACMASLSGPEYLVTATNRRFQRLVGNRLLAGRPLREALPELQGQPLLDLLDETYRTGAINYGQQEVRLQQITSSTPRGMLYFTFLVQAVRGPAGTVTGLLLFAYDMSVHVAVRESVRPRAAARKPAGPRETPADLAARLLLANEALVVTNEELSVTNEELATANEELMKTNRELEATVAQLRAALADNQAKAHNIVQLSASHAVLDTTNQHLSRANVELDAFVYTASHDLNGPINNLDGLLRVLRDELPATDPAASVGRILELMHESVGRFRHTLQELGTIARAQAATERELPLVPLADVVRDVLLDLALPIAEAGAQLTVQVDDCPAVPFAEKNLRSVVYNLISNAVKYRHPDRAPQVRVECRAEARCWVLEVQDNGLGLDLTQGPPAFALFQRFHTHVDGSGVGLYMVQKLVEHEGGRLEVTSELGNGSTFRVYFKMPRYLSGAGK